MKTMNLSGLFRQTSINCQPDLNIILSYWKTKTARLSHKPLKTLHQNIRNRGLVLYIHRDQEKNVVQLIKANTHFNSSNWKFSAFSDQQLHLAYKNHLIIKVMRIWLASILLTLFITSAMPSEEENDKNVEQIEQKSYSQLGNSNKNSEDCIKECGQDKICLKKCKEQESVNDPGPYIFLGFITVYLITFTIYFCIQRFQLCCCHPYKVLKRQHNRVKNQSMLKQEFIAKRDLIIQALRNSPKQNNFFLTQNDQRYVIYVSSLKILNQQPFQTEIEMKGEDRNKWTAHGYILTKGDQIFMWFIKRYQNWEKVNAPCCRQVKPLIYECEGDEEGYLMTGKWYYDEHKYSLEYSGTWTLEEPEATDDEEIIYEQEEILM